MGGAWRAKRLGKYGVWALSSAGCTSTTSPSASSLTPSVSEVAPVPSAGWEQGSWGKFHSLRFHVWLSLPDGGSWRIDDHRSSWFVATHTPTQSTLRLRVVLEDAAMSHRKCEQHARELDPSLPMEISTELVEARDSEVLPGWDAHAFSIVAPARSAPGVLEGQWVVFAAHIRKCLLVHYVTRAPKNQKATIGVRFGDIAQRLVHELSFDRELEGPGRLPFP